MPVVVEVCGVEMSTSARYNMFRQSRTIVESWLGDSRPQVRRPWRKRSRPAANMPPAKRRPVDVHRTGRQTRT
eukprot:928872-Pyramimonas_sp.AAC.1